MVSFGEKIGEIIYWETSEERNLVSPDSMEELHDADPNEVEWNDEVVRNTKVKYEIFEKGYVRYEYIENLDGWGEIHKYSWDYPNEINGIADVLTEFVRGNEVIEATGEIRTELVKHNI